MACDPLFKSDRPAIPKRGVHLDLKGLPPTPERLVELLNVFAAARYNVVLVEWEDSFPWTVDERFRSHTAYTPEDVALFCKAAADLRLELIPLVQCLGHMETPLSVPGYEHLREVPDNESGLNPLAPGARELIQNMVDDVLRLMPGTSHIHLGGDEARTFGKHPDTREYIAKHGKGALYLHHITPILDTLNERNVRPILWHDMMIDWDSAALTSLASKSDLMPWGYAGHPDTTQHHFNTRYIQRFHEHGFKLWGATAYKGAEGYDSDLPDISLHTDNAQAWMEVAQRFHFTGVVATAWSRYGVDTLQCNPIDASLDSMVLVAVILHDGKPPEGGAEACVDALAEWGQRERFDSCKRAVRQLAGVRQRGWQKIQHARQVTVLGKIDPRRTSARNPLLGLRALVELEAIVAESDQIAEEVHRCFDGLVAAMWIEEYLATRLAPLREELSLLKSA